MTSVTTLSVPGRPTSIAAASGSGPVYVDCGEMRGETATFSLHAVDLDGGVRWRRRIESVRGGPQVASDGGIWHGGRRTVSETRPDGSPGRVVEFQCEADEMLGEFLALPDGFVIAWMVWDSNRARVERTDVEGNRRWSTPLPVATVAYEGITQVRRETGWRSEPVLPWAPALFPEHREGLLVSGDRLLATYFEPSGGLSLSWCIDVETGEVAWVTPPRPQGSRAIAGPGRFVVGVGGYGAFESRLYERDGSVLASWPSHGLPLVSHRGRIRVLEMDNDLSADLRLRRLHRDGTMTTGPSLPGYYTVGPVLSSDGRAAFWRNGRLQVSTPKLSVRTLHKDRKWGGVGRMLLLDGGALVFVLDHDDDDPTSRSGALMLARTDLAPLDDGPWPCGEGNLRGNPVLYA